MRNLDDMEILIRKEFLTETQTMLTECEQLYLILERKPNDVNSLDRIYRTIHGLKGSSGSVGFHGLSTYVGKVETMINHFRGPFAKAVDLDVIRVLLSTTETLRMFVAKLQADHKAPFDTKTSEQAMATCLARWDAKPASPTPAPAVATPVAAAPVATMPNPASALIHTPTTTAAPTPTAPPSPLSASTPAVAPLQSQAVAATATTASKPSIAAAVLTQKKFRILICDDEPEIVDTIRCALEMGPFEFFQAIDGIDALELLKKQTVDLMIIDTHMPRLSGPGLIAEARVLLPNMPFIVISGGSERADLISYIQLGAYSFLEKPFMIESLHNLVRHVLRESIFRQSVLDLSRQMFKAHMTMKQASEYLDAQANPALRDSVFKAQELLQEAADVASKAIEQGDLQGFGT